MGATNVSVGDFLFFLGMGLVIFGLVWRSRLRRSEEAITRRQFFSGPFVPIVVGVVIAIWSLYKTGDL